MDPQPVTGGCPESTDKRNAELHASGFFGPGAPAPKSERDRIAAAGRAVRCEPGAGAVRRAAGRLRGAEQRRGGPLEP